MREFAEQGCAGSTMPDRAESESRCRQVLASEPDRLDAIHDLGSLLQGEGRHGEAVEHYRVALERQPTQVSLYIGLAAAFHGAGSPEAATEVCEMALRLEPDCAEAHNNLGVALKALGRLPEAEAHLRRAVELRADYVEALDNLGNVLKLAGDPAAAVDCYRRALEIKPDHASTYSNLGNALLALGREAEAAEFYDVALQLAPELASARWNRALLWLQQGDFERGWPEYEWGFAAGERLPRDLERPRWQGEAVSGRRVLVWAEQGFGDALQFMRYLPMLRERGAQVLFECPRELVALARDSGLADVVIEHGAGETVDFDLHAPLLGLPALLAARVDNIPAPAGYLQADPARVAAWCDRMGPEAGLRVGVAWSGNPRQPVNRLRACAPEQLVAALGAVPGISLYSLQKGSSSDAVRDRLIDFTAELNDFADTAAFMMNLDLIVTVDTSVAHLAGALGRTVWTLLSQPADWRWMGQGADTPWYRSMHLLRQPQPGEWGALLDLARQILIEVCGNDTTTPVAAEAEPAPESAAQAEGRADFNQIHDQSYPARLASAREVLAGLWDVLRPRSVLDVGCGLGAWLEVSKEHGAEEVAGVDGAWIEPDRVRLAPNEFRQQDLEQPLDLGRRFDLVISLEVAEHLRPECAESFVDSLVRHGDVVLFSAAIPGQGGNGHLNEQLQHYWAGLFAARGYVPVDVVRPRIWLNGNVFWWLQQNTVLYVRGESLPRWPALHPFVVERPAALSIVHPELYALKLQALAAASAGSV